MLLNPIAAQNFDLAVHELATNAAKYGALSTSDGCVEISWRVQKDRVFVFNWLERDGPPVHVPAEKGFGSVVLEHVMGEYGCAALRIQFEPEGIRYEVRCELEKICAPAVRR